nr:hypothetical protein [Bacteriovoracaceae bacterium]
ELSATAKAMQELTECVYLLQDKIKKEISFVDVGGGLGIPYHPQDENSIATPLDYMKTVAKNLGKDLISKKIIFEPGRIIAASCGILVSRVIRTKTSQKNTFVIIDAGMNDLLRPSLYQAYHSIYPTSLTENTKIIPSHIVGPVCESSDCFASNRPFPVVKTDDLVVISDSGAYGHTMSSGYNLRSQIKEYCY